jgi:hypothetical protein
MRAHAPPHRRNTPVLGVWRDVCKAAAQRTCDAALSTPERAAARTSRSRHVIDQKELERHRIPKKRSCRIRASLRDWASAPSRAQKSRFGHAAGREPAPRPAGRGAARATASRPARRCGHRSRARRWSPTCCGPCAVSQTCPCANKFVMPSYWPGPRIVLQVRRAASTGGTYERRGQGSGQRAGAR